MAQQPKLQLIWSMTRSPTTLSSTNVRPSFPHVADGPAKFRASFWCYSSTIHLNIERKHYSLFDTPNTRMYNICALIWCNWIICISIFETDRYIMISMYIYICIYTYIKPNDCIDVPCIIHSHLLSSLNKPIKSRPNKQWSTPLGDLPTAWNRACSFPITCSWLDFKHRKSKHQTFWQWMMCESVGKYMDNLAWLNCNN